MESQEQAYGRPAPSVFASYCSADKLAVLPLLQAMRDAGFSIWHEDADWSAEDLSDEAVAKLEESAAYLAFVSQAFQESHACRKAFNRAMQQDKPFVAVLLGDFAASPALQMQLASVQAIRANDYDDFAALAAALVTAMKAKTAVVEPDMDGDGSRLDAADVAPGKADASNEADEGQGQRSDGRNAASRKRFPHVWGLGLAVAAIAIAALLFLGNANGLFNWFGQPDSAGEYTLSTARPALKSGDYADVLLTAVDETSVEDFRRAMELVKGRLDAYVGEGKYDLTVHGDKALLAVPTECLDGNPVGAILKAFISRPMELSFIDYDSEEVRESAVPVARDDIETVAVVDDFSDATRLPDEVEKDPDSFGVVRITFTEAFSQEHAGIWTATGNKLCIAQDISYSTFQYWLAATSDDGRSVYVFISQPRPEDLESLAYSYSHEPLPIKFRYRTNYVQTAEWEQVQGNSEAGSLQVDRSELTGEVMTLAFGPDDSRPALTAGELLDWEDAMKKRFDALGHPYAMGVVEFTDETSGEDVTRLVVATPNRELEAAEATVVGYGRYETPLLFNGRKSAPIISPIASAAHIEQDKDGRIRLRVNIAQLEEASSNSDAGYFSQLMDASAVGDRVQLVVKQSIVCSATYAGVQDGAHVFTDLKTPNGLAVEEEGGSWVVNVLPVYFDTTAQMAARVQQCDTEYTVDDRLTVDQEGDIIQDPLDQEMIRRISEIVPDCQIRDSGECIWVFLHLPVDENLPHDGLQISREIYEAMADCSPAWRRVVVVLADEDEDAGERARVAADWNRNYQSIEPDIQFDCYVYGGRFDEYGDDFRAILKNDEFWTEQQVGDWTRSGAEADAYLERLDQATQRLEHARDQGQESTSGPASPE